MKITYVVEIIRIKGNEFPLSVFLSMSFRLFRGICLFYSEQLMFRLFYSQ